MADRMNIKFTLQAVDRFSRNMDKLERKLDSVQAAADKFDINRDVQITADTAQALNEIKTLQQRMNAVDKSAKKERKLKFKTEHAERELDRMGNIINGMSPSVIDINADTRSTFNELRRVDDFLADIRRNNTEIKTKIDMDSGGAERSLARITDMITGIGDRRLQIDGDNSGAMRSLREVDTFMTDLQRDNRKLRTDFEIEIGGATRSLQRIARQTDRARNSARLHWPMHIDTMQATNALRGLQRVVNRATPDREIDVSVDLDGAMERLTAIGTLASTISRIEPTIDVDADVAGAAARLSLIERIKARVGRPVIVDVLVGDYMTFRRNMDRIATTGRNVGEILMNTFMGLATTFSTTLVPIIASATGAIGALGVMVGVTGGATMGLVSAFTGAGVAAAGFAAVAIPAINGVMDRATEIQDLESKISLAKANGEFEKANELIAQMDGIFADMTETQVTAHNALLDFRNVYGDLVDNMEPGVLTAFGNALTGLTALIRVGEGIIEDAVDAMVNLTAAFNANIEAEDMKAFFAFMDNTAATSLENVTKAVGNFIAGFLNMVTAFGPLSMDISAGLLDMSEKFREWSAALGENEKFQAFVEYVRTNWPLVRSIIGTAIAAIIETFAGFSSYAESWMATTQDLIDKWREFAQGMGENEKFQAFVEYIKTNGPLVTAMIGDMVQFLVALGVALAPVGAKMVEVASAVFDFLTNGLQANPVLGEMLGWFVTLAGAFFTLLPLGMAVISFFNSITTVGGIVIGFVKKIASRFGSLTSIVMRVKSAFETLYLIFLGINSVVAVVVAAAAVLVAAIVRMWRENERFREIVTQVWEAIKIAYSTAVEWISSVVTSVIGALVGWWETNQGTFLSVAQTVWDTVYSVIETAIMWVLETVMSVAGRISAFWSEHGDTILAIAKFAWEAIMTTIDQFISVISGIIEVGLGIIQGLFEIVWPVISAVVKVAWELITSIVETSLDVVWGIIETIMNLIEGDWEAAWESIKGIAEDIWDGIMGFFESINLFDLGADIIQGLIDGLWSMADAVWDTAKDVAGGLADVARNILDTHSPSRVFRSIGEDTMMGMQVGIENEASRTVNAVARVAEDLTNAFNPKLDASMSVAGGTANHAYTSAGATYSKARADKAARQRQHVEVPVILNGREIARASAGDVTDIQSMENNLRDLYNGGV